MPLETRAAISAAAEALITLTPLGEASTCFIRLICANCSTSSNAFVRSRSSDRDRIGDPPGNSGSCAVVDKV
jgi:hypothetical protein